MTPPALSQPSARPARQPAASAARSEAPAPRSYHHGNLRASLVAHAAAILERDGLEAVSLRAVAVAAGVSHNAPYRHFESHHYLLSAVAVLGMEDLRAAMLQASSAVAAEAAAAVGGPPERLRAVGRVYVAFARARPGMFRLLFEHRRSVTVAELQAIGPDTFAVLDAAVRACLPPAQADAPQSAASTAVWALIHGLATLLLHSRIRPFQSGEMDPEALIENVLAALPATARATAGNPAAANCKAEPARPAPPRRQAVAGKAAKPRRASSTGTV